MFLRGLEKLGRGNWRGISRNFVRTRTPTQVASHAQKYFLRQNAAASGAVPKRKRRPSLLDGISQAVDSHHIPRALPHNLASPERGYISINQPYDQQCHWLLSRRLLPTVGNKNPNGSIVNVALHGPSGGGSDGVGDDLELKLAVSISSSSGKLGHLSLVAS